MDMQTKSSMHRSGCQELRQHFQNYFELLLGVERSKLQRFIDSSGAQSEQRELLSEIDCRINYLRGAVRMGKLLCLIDPEEAKSNWSVLDAERDRLRAVALSSNAKAADFPRSTSNAMRLAEIAKSIR